MACETRRSLQAQHAQNAVPQVPAGLMRRLGRRREMGWVDNKRDFWCNCGLLRVDRKARKLMVGKEVEDVAMGTLVGGVVCRALTRATR